MQLIITEVARLVVLYYSQITMMLRLWLFLIEKVSRRKL